MKKYEITKEQIINLHKSYCLSELKDDLEMMFPDAFKKELVFGKWYKSTDSLFCITKIEGENAFAFGFDNGKWSDEAGFNIRYAKNDIEATSQEVETALINEAKKRYTIGTLFKSLNVCSLNEQCEINNYIFSFGGNFRLYTSLGDCIFSDGVWSEIIETISKEEAEKLLNKKIV